MIDRDRPGCPQCRAKLVRRLRGEPWTDPGWGPGLPVRHYGTEYIAIAALVAALAGTAVAAYGQYQAGQAQNAAAQYNAILAEQQGAYQNQLAQFQAGMLERQMMGMTALAEAEAAFGEQSAAFGTAAAEQQALAARAAAEAAGNVREDGIRRAYGRTQSEVRAAIGKSGVDTTGSPLMVLLENADTVGQELALSEYQTTLDNYETDLGLWRAQVGEHTARAESQLIRNSAGLRADALRHEASYVRYGGLAALSGAQGQAAMYRFGGASASRASMFNVGSTLLTGFGGAASPYLRYGRAT